MKYKIKQKPTTWWDRNWWGLLLLLSFLATGIISGYLWAANTIEQMSH